MTHDAVEELARRARNGGFTVAVAESLTCGKLASALGAAGEASEWFRGGVIAYANEVKFEVLGVKPGPVITESCAREMALGAQRLLTADLAIAVTGVGGPGAEEGNPEGTVFIAVAFPGRVEVREQRFGGGPDAILVATVHAAVEQSLGLLRSLAQEG